MLPQKVLKVLIGICLFILLIFLFDYADFVFKIMIMVALAAAYTKHLLKKEVVLG